MAQGVARHRLAVPRIAWAAVSRWLTLTYLTLIREMRWSQFRINQAQLTASIPTSTSRRRAISSCRSVC